MPLMKTSNPALSDNTFRGISGSQYGGPYGAMTDATSRITFPRGLRHGSFLRITQAEYNSINSLQQP